MWVALDWAEDLDAGAPVPTATSSLWKCVASWPRRACLMAGGPSDGASGVPSHRPLSNNPDYML